MPAAMAHSRNLINAQIHFIDERLSLVHIPLRIYTEFVQPILQLLYPISKSISHDSHERNGHTSNGVSDYGVPSTPWSNQHPFLNISITPLECSILCSKELAQQYFAPVISRLHKAFSKNEASISSEDFIAVSVEGEGLEAGQRVLELTSPLAMAGISIFFITTYFSDYILVPSKSRTAVILALENQGFTFSKSSSNYISYHHHSKSSTSSLTPSLPGTPPPSTISELQSRTFALLKRRGISPTVHSSVRLIQCASSSHAPSGGNNHLYDGDTTSTSLDLELQLGLLKTLIHPPSFLSLTLTSSDPASLLLEQHSLQIFGDGILLTNNEELIPITLNLDSLPLEASGIVCTVAGKLVGDGSGGPVGLGEGSVEMSYLSTAKAGTVMVEVQDLERAVRRLGVEGGV